jgi:CHAT domain-containing protein
VIVPDGQLYLLPFGALRATASSAPLAVRYQLSIVPSATLWLRFRQAAPVPAPGVVLALADPALAGADLRQGAVERGWTRGVRLDPLPQARREGRALVRYLGPPSRLLVGEEASESALKAFGPRRFRIVHFAAHALVDGENPRRSAVVLAPGSATEDGLLQPEEIARMGLDGALVVLSTCQGASGNALAGEGPLSLARAFFQAGARAVVASLWSLRDDEAAALFESFYRHLGRGASVAEALGAAQRQLIDDGAPAAAWAGVVALGDGGLVPLPGGRPRVVSPRGLLGLAVVAAVLLGVAGQRLLRRSRAAS